MFFALKLFVRGFTCLLRDLSPLALPALLFLTAPLTQPGWGQSLYLETDWKRDGFVRQRFQIMGTGGRNNPLRRPLRQAFDGDAIYVRFTLRYAASSIDTPLDGDGEFFVLWLDDQEGNATSTHHLNVPNIGLHVDGDKNRFMVRYSSNNQQFGPALQGDRDTVVVARLSKSKIGPSEPFDQLSLWVDPTPDAENKPVASTKNRQALARVTWLGFSTGGKTELEDVIEVSEIGVATSWREIFGLPPKPTTEIMPLPSPTLDFTSQILPILRSHCFECHAGEDAENNVHLDRWDDVLNQTTPRNSKQSRLYELVANGEMPPGEKHLSKAELEILETWINEGVHWDEEQLPTPTPTSQHWAFQPIERPSIPTVQRSEWIRSPIDAFIAHRHEQRGLTPAPTADPKTLARRASLTLLGLPPTPNLNFDTEESTQQLLNDPAYAERWARHWLDVARWAESNGHQHNRMRPHAWRYRDWVISAFQHDKPFDQFVLEQVAGDEMEPSLDESLVATGFLAAARYSGNELDKQIQRNEILVDITNTTAQAFLGLTIQCAQCHTHRFDPISIRDYYRFQAFFGRGQPGNLVLGSNPPESRDWIDQRWQIFDSTKHRLINVKRKQGHPEPILVTPKAVIAALKGNEKARFKQLESQIEPLAKSWGFYSPVASAQSTFVAPHEMRWPLPRASGTLASNQTHVLIRGDVKVPGPEVQAGWPALFGPSKIDPQKPRTSLAKWIASRNNPLTARVWVNRIWQWHFGRGLVETSGDFGIKGSQPSHPELLDFLASELMESGWSTRHVQQLIINSSTYRQASQFSASNSTIDPDNQSYWRWTPRRLEAEAIRDCMLFAAGLLDPKTGGVSVANEANRRSLYLTQQRDHLPDQQGLFDGPGGVVSCSRRRVSTTALQPLWLMNSTLAQQASEGLAARAGTVQAAIKIAFGRDANQAELDTLQQLATKYGLASACSAILNSSEFIYIP
jgi:mono/diheme cytochrome c family protein